MSFVDKVKEMLGQHPDQAKQGVEKSGDVFDQKTGGKYADKVDKVQEKGSDYIDRSGEGGGHAGGEAGGQTGGQTGGEAGPNEPR